MPSPDESVRAQAVDRALAAAGMYRRRGEVEAAWRAVDDALAIDPRSAAVFELMGDLNCDQEDYPAALQCYRKSLEFEPGRKGAEVGVGRATVMLEAPPPNDEDDPALQAIVARRKPETAAGLSFIVPGLGQMYAMQFSRGGLFFGIALVLWLLVSRAFVDVLETLHRSRAMTVGGGGWFLLTVLTVWQVYAALDAYACVQRLKGEGTGLR